MPSDVTLISTNVSGVSTRLLVNGQPVKRFDHGAPSLSVNRLEVQLVRDDRPLLPGGLGGQNSGNPSYFYVCTAPGTVGSYCNNNMVGLAIALSAKVALISGTCKTPDQSVSLPIVPVHKFSGVGSNIGAYGAKSFSLNFEQCPPGYAKIGYVLAPIGTPLPAIDGTLPIRTGSTATGISVQLIDGKGVPAKFNQTYSLTPYDPLKGGTYSVPMTARYVQTASSIGAGTLQSAMSILMDYQ